MSLKHQIARKEIIDASNMLIKNELVIGTWGNISVRIVGEDLVAITPTGVDYDKLIPENIPIVDLEGNLIDGNMKPSSEMPLHLEIYKSRSDVNAIIHTHSVHCTALAIARKPLPAVCEDLVQVAGGAVNVSDFRLPGATDLGQVVLKALKDRQAVLMANHGLLSAGMTLKETLKIAMICEKSAQATLLAANIGGAVEIDESDWGYMRDYYLNKYGQKG